MSTVDPKVDAAGADAAARSRHDIEPLSQTEEIVKAFIEAHGAEMDGASGSEADGVVRYSEFCAWLQGDSGQASFGAEFEGVKKDQILQAAVESRTHDKGYSWLDIAASTGGEGSRVIYAPAPDMTGGDGTQADGTSADGTSADGTSADGAGQAAGVGDGADGLRKTADALDQLGGADGRIALSDISAAVDAGNVFSAGGFELAWAKSVVGLAGDSAKLSSVGFAPDAADGKWYITTDQYVDALVRFYSYN